MKDRNNDTSQSRSAANGEPPTGSPSVSAGRRPKRPSANRRSRGQLPVRALIETAGPEPNTPLSEVRLTVGRIGGPHGVQGEMKLRILTDDPEHLATIRTVYLGERTVPIVLESIRFMNEGALIKLEGTHAPEDAALLSGLAVKIAGSDARPLAEGEYFLFQLIGLKAFLEDETPVGTVTDLIETGANDVLVIGERQDSSGDLLVPNHPEFVLEISPEKGRIVIRPPVYAN